MITKKKTDSRCRVASRDRRHRREDTAHLWCDGAGYHRAWLSLL